MPMTHTLNTVILARHEDKNALVSFGLALPIVIILFEATTISLSTVLETLVSQANGAGDHELCGIYLNRQYLINTVFFILLCVPMLWCEDFLVNTLDQSPQVAATAKDACRILIIGSYF